MKKNIPTTIASIRIKYLERNVTKEEKNIHNKAYKILMKGTEEDTKKWKDIPYP